MAELRRKQGYYAEAIESYRAVLAVDPEFAMAWAGMGDAMFHLERYEEAIESLDRSVALHPHPPTSTIVAPVATKRNVVTNCNSFQPRPCHGRGDRVLMARSRSPLPRTA